MLDWDPLLVVEKVAEWSAIAGSSGRTRRLGPREQGTDLVGAGYKVWMCLCLAWRLWIEWCDAHERDDGHDAVAREM